MVAKTDVETVLECYVRIHLACHLRQLEGARRGSEISANQAGILELLSGSEGIAVLDLARHAGVAPSTMSLTLDRLERGGFVKRVKDPGDGRRTMVLLTEKGLRTRNQQKVLQPELIAAMLERLSMSKRKEALAGLRLLNEAATELVSSADYRELVRR
jgi:DNA-binding MarR family transcriptional regulator